MEIPDRVVEACQRGDERAFEELVRLSHKEVFSLAYRLTGNREDAADAAQDAYLKVVRSIRKFRGDAKFSTWLYRVTANSAISILRKRARRPEIFVEHPSDFPSSADPAADAETTELRGILEDALKELPEGYRAVVVLKDVYGFSLAEVGKMIGIKEGAAKVRLFRARRRLKDILSDQPTGRSRRKRKKQ